MSVAAILNQKGSAAVETIAAGATVREAVEALARLRIGALIVSPDGEALEGIISERDIVQLIARGGPDALSSPVGDVMTRKVEHCAMNEHALRVLRRMTKGRFRHMPVMDDEGRLRAVISIGDVVNFRLREMEMEKQALEGMIMGA